MMHKFNKEDLQSSPAAFQAVRAVSPVFTSFPVTADITAPVQLLFHRPAFQTPILPIFTLCYSELHHSLHLHLHHHHQPDDPGDPVLILLIAGTQFCYDGSSESN